MFWFTSKNPHLDRILAWIEDNILDRIYHKRILKRLQEAINSGFVEL